MDGQKFQKISVDFTDAVRRPLILLLFACEISRLAYDWFINIDPYLSLARRRDSRKFPVPVPRTVKSLMSVEHKDAENVCHSIL